MKRTALVVLVALLASVQMYAADPWLGTWKFNPVKSKSTTSNALKSRTDTFELTADGSIKLSRTEVRADGTTYKGSSTYKMDGKEYKATGLQWDTIVAKRLSDWSYQTVTTKKGGPYNQTTTNVFSADGRTKTATTKGTDSNGKMIESTYVYEKQ